MSINKHLVSAHIILSKAVNICQSNGLDPSELADVLSLALKMHKDIMQKANLEVNSHPAGHA